MEKQTSLHLAVVDEPLAAIEPEPLSGDSLLFPELNPKKRLSGAWIPLIFFTLALFIVSLASPVLALRKGASGSDVTALQKSLQADGYFNGPVTGYYGSLTQEAVMRFQQAQGLTPDGIVGAKTRTALGSSSLEPADSFINSQTQTPLDSSSLEPADSFINSQTQTLPDSTSPVTPLPTAVPDQSLRSAKPNFILQRGDRNSQVTSLQKNLQISGYFHGPVTGYYGSTTQAAVIEFQKAKGLTPDGIAGPKTRAALESDSPTSNSSPLPSSSVTVTDDRVGFANPGLVLRRGHRNTNVTALQKKLQDAGYFNGPLTGYYGSMTQEAVMAFQKAKGLTPDGIVGSKTRAILDSDSESPTPSQTNTPGSVFNQESFLNE